MVDQARGLDLDGRDEVPTPRASPRK
jgi:hypothetical protein